jgi:hypothetical protein
VQLAHLVERVNRNVDETRLTGAVFLDLSKAFDTVCVKGLLYKLTISNITSDMVNIIPYIHLRAFQMAFKSPTPTLLSMLTGVSQGGMPPLCCSV